MQTGSTLPAGRERLTAVAAAGALAGTAFAVSGLPTQAATVEFITSANVASVRAEDEFGNTVPNDLARETFESPGTDGNFAQSSSFSTPREAASAFAAADVASGVLRVAVSANAEINAPNTVGTAAASANARAQMSETLTISGSGTVTVEMEYNGLWDVTGQELLFGSQPSTADPSWFIQGILSIPFAQDGFVLGSGQGTATSGMVSDVLRVSRNVQDGEVMTINTVLQLNQNSGTNGFIDFSRTAYLSVIFSEGVTGTFADPQFLTVDPRAEQGIGVIPLPASIWLLLGGLGGLAALGRRRAR